MEVWLSWLMEFSPTHAGTLVPETAVEDGESPNSYSCKNSQPAKRLPHSAVKAMVSFHIRCDRWCLYSARVGGWSFGVLNSFLVKNSTPYRFLGKKWGMEPRTSQDFRSCDRLLFIYLWRFWPLIILSQLQFFLSPKRDILSNLNYFPVSRVGNLTKKLQQNSNAPPRML